MRRRSPVFVRRSMIRRAQPLILIAREMTERVGTQTHRFVARREIDRARASYLTPTPCTSRVRTRDGRSAVRLRRRALLDHLMIRGRRSVRECRQLDRHDVFRRRRSALHRSRVTMRERQRNEPDRKDPADMRDDRCRKGESRFRGLQIPLRFCVRARQPSLSVRTDIGFRHPRQEPM